VVESGAEANVETDFIDEGEDRTLDKIIEALESLPIPPAEPPCGDMRITYQKVCY
jgi:hypothetical protein